MPKQLPFFLWKQDAHAPDEKRKKSRRTPLQGRTKPSVTSVLFADSHTLASGGAYGLAAWGVQAALGAA